MFGRLTYYLISMEKIETESGLEGAQWYVCHVKTRSLKWEVYCGRNEWPSYGSYDIAYKNEHFVGL